MKYENDWWLGGFLIAFIAGLLSTLIYTWYLVPQMPPTTPAQLNAADKATYIVLIAAAYRHDGDLDKAKGRLVQLEDDNIQETIVSLTEIYITNQADSRDIRSLVALATALGETHPFMLAYLTPTPQPSPLATLLPTPSATQPPTPLPTPLPTATTRPTSTAIPTVNPTITLRTPRNPRPNDPFQLAQSVALCNNTASEYQLRVYVRDWQGKGVSGVQLLITWIGGEDTFFTGFKPEIDLGYADYQMLPEQIYQVEIVGLTSKVAKDINKGSQTLCSSQGGANAPSWQIVFQQGDNQ